MKNLTTTNNEVQTYNFMGNSIRLVMINETPWFIAKDVCDALEIGHTQTVIKRLSSDETITVVLNHFKGRGNQRKTLVNEPGLYALVSQSRKPEAKAFQRWVNHEVLPSIMKTGSYSVPTAQPKLPIPTFTRKELILMALEAEERVEELEAEKLILQPKAAQWDKFLDADGLTTMTNVGKHFLGGLTANKVAKYLQEKGILFKNKIDSCYVPRLGYEKYFKRVPFFREDYEGNGVTVWTLKFNNEGIDFIVGQSKGPLAAR